MDIKKFLTMFNNHSEFEEFITGDTHYYPNTSYCKQENEVHYEPIEYVTGLTLNKSSVTLKRGETEQLIATVLPSTATMPNVVWKSSRSKLVSVTQDGTITIDGVSGDCSIYAIAADGSGVSAKCDVHIDFVPVTGVDLDKYTATIETEGTLQLNATITPSDATIQDVKWTSSNPSLISVDRNGLCSTTARTGEAIITVTTVDGGFSKSCAVTINYVPVEGISLESAITIDSGDTYQLIPIFEPSEASIKRVTWESSDPSVIAVDENGNVTPQMYSGDAVVTVTTVDGGYTAACEVHINFIFVSGVTLNTDYLGFDYDGPSAQTLTATVLPTDAFIQDVLWTSSDESIATVDENGVVTATNLGNTTGYCTITVTTVDGGYTAECTVKVKPDYDKRCLTVRQLTGGASQLIWSYTSSAVANGEISFDEGLTWQTAPQGNFATSGAGATVMFRRNYIKQGQKDDNLSGVIHSSDQNVQWEIEGNIMSLIYGADFIGKDSWTGVTTDKNLFSALFGAQGFSTPFNVIRANDLSLPATALTEGCYMRLFGSSNLRIAPKLKATVLAPNCYYAMFSECHLTSIPELPAQVIENQSYGNMFRANEYLTEIPALSNVTSFAVGDYISGHTKGMFANCTNLKTLPEKLFPNCNTIGYETCYGMFSGCTGLEEVPSGFFSNITSTRTSAFNSMFQGCTSLTAAPDIPISMINQSVCQNMYKDCTSLTTLPKFTSSSLTISTSGLSSMFQGCTALKEVPSDYLSKVTSMGSYCYSGMFKGCTSLEKSPVLPASALTSYCYQGMFSGCTSLNEITCMALSATTSYTQNWGVSVSGSGTFYKHENASGWIQDNTSSIPPGWTPVNVSLTLNKESAAISTGDTLQLTATLSPLSGSQLVTWESSNPTIATVDENGLVTAVGEGMTTIKATSVLYGVSAVCEIYTNMNNVVFTLKAKGASTINANVNAGYNVSASTDGTTWEQVPQGTTSYTIDTGDTVMFKANFTGSSASSAACTFEGSTGEFIAMGNPMSLIYGDNFSAQTSIGNASLARLLAGASGLTSASLMVLPATTLKQQCYSAMFQGCTALEDAPSLPAETLANSCYESMFGLCSRLKEVPRLPATTLASNCYRSMFYSCTSLTEIPSDLLPATAVTSDCYHTMFSGCTSLTEVPEGLLPATTMASFCYAYMFQNCSNIRTIPETLLPAMTLADSCYQAMFSTCTSLEEIPEKLLPATTLASNCYRSMFYSCTSLTEIPSDLLQATTLANNCYELMFRGCTSLTTVPDGLLPATTLANSCYQGMFSACTSLVTVSVDLLPATSLPSSGYQAMFSDCRSLTNSPEIPATTVGRYSCEQMFNGCSALTATTSTLPASNIGNYSYQQMYKGCTSLVTAPYIAVTGTVASYGCYRMFSGCTSLVNTQEKLEAATIEARGCFDMYAICKSLVEQPEIMATVGGAGSLGYMFNACTSLSAAKHLHFTEFGGGGDDHTPIEGTCGGMYQGCTSLVSVPRNMIPNIPIRRNVFNSMFWGCTSLTATPIIPSMETVNQSNKWAYYDMFRNCRSLKEITCLIGTNQPDNFDTTFGWTSGVTVNNGTLYRKAGTTWTTPSSGDQYNRGAGLPSGWTVVDYVEATSVSMSDTAITLSNGDTYQLTATVLPNDATDTGVTWTSSDTSVATVDANGLVTAVGTSGTATITATSYYGSYTATCEVTIV